MIAENEIPEPPEPSDILTSGGLSYGPPITPFKRLETIDSGTWENITLELVSHWKKIYTNVTKCGGSGDMGRDIIAYNPNGTWENFQCKYYKSPLSVAEAISEIGKLIYHAYNNDYSLPVKYYFVVSKGIASDLINCLMDTTKLKEELIKRWEKSCLTKIKSTKTPLDENLKDFINEHVDFSIFDHIPPLRIIELHQKTAYHYIQFGNFHKKRIKPKIPPIEIEKNEITYTKELLRAFSDAENTEIDINNLSDFDTYYEDLNDARINFYSCEGLEKFSRDWLPDDTFDNFLDDVHQGILPTIKLPYDNAYIKYLKVSEKATDLDYSSYALHANINNRDKNGICHRLVNDKKIKWKK